MFKPGQNLSCTVIAKEPNGFTVSIAPDSSVAFLPTSSSLTIGSQIDTYFVMWHEGRPVVADKSKSLEQGCRQLADLAEKTTDPAIRNTLTGIIARATQHSVEREQANNEHMGLDLSTIQGSIEQKLLKLLTAWHLISSEKSASFLAQQAEQPEFPMPQLLHAAGYLTDKQFETVSRGVSLVNSGAVDFRQFAVAYRDELDGSITFDESLKLRGWL